MLKKAMRLGSVLLLCSACGGSGDYARPSAVHDGRRALGLVQMPGGTYEFKLCEVTEAYTPEVLEERCINPLLTADGLPLVLSEVPVPPGTLATKFWQMGVTVGAAAVAGLVVFALGRHIVKMKAGAQLGREAYYDQLVESLKRSKSIDGNTLVSSNGALVEKVKLGGKEYNLRALLENKKLQKKLSKKEKLELGVLLLNLENSLKSGTAYADSLTQAITKINGQPDGGIAKALSENSLIKTETDENGRLVKLVLDDGVVESLRKNRPLDEQSHEALQALDELVSREARINRLERGLAENSKKIAKLIKGNDEMDGIVSGKRRSLVLSDTIKDALRKGEVDTKSSEEKTLRKLEELIDKEALGSKTPLYKTRAQGYEEIARKAIYSKERVSPIVAETGEKIVAKIAGQLDGQNYDLIARLEEQVRKAGNLEDLQEGLTEVVGESHKDLKKIITETVKNAPTAKRGGFSGGFKPSKWFTYWDEDKSKLPSYMETTGDPAVRVVNRKKVVSYIANNKEVGEVQVERGIEKFIGQAAGAAVVIISTTALRKKLPGHAKLSATERWDALTGDFYELTTEGRVADMHTIIKGIAAVTGGEVSDEVFYFMLRSGLRSER